MGPACFYLGTIYLEGDFISVDAQKAVDYFLQGAELNNAFCLYELSLLHGEGECVVRDHDLE